MKSVSVILAFHAHEPSWDLPAAVLASLADGDLAREDVGNDNWIAKRAVAGRDVYGKVIELADRLGAPVCLEATNELLMQVRHHMPETFARLVDSYRSGAIYPIYGNAFHTHIAMISDEELADELRLNVEYVHDVIGAPRPRHAGAFPMEGSIDAHKLAGFRRAGMEYVVFPQISPSLTRYRWEGGQPSIDAHGDITSPFVIGSAGEELLALSRHFRISQEIWRPITKWKPELLAAQGYILGKYAVLDEEYRSGHTVEFPIAREQAVAAYTQTLREALADAPDGALLLYIQDLELMDFGEEALEILGDAWAAVRREGVADVRFVTPDTYIDDLAQARETLPRLRFHQASWAPEIRLVLRSDGHYPPRGAGEFRGRDSDVEVFRRWPFVFWELGRFISDTCKELLRGFGVPLEVPASASQLEAMLRSGVAAQNVASEGARAPSAEVDARLWLAINMRAMQRACNVGWQPDEARHKWLYMHAFVIVEQLRSLLASGTGVVDFRRFSERALRGLDRVLEIFIDTRIAYLRRGSDRLGERAGNAERRAEAEAHLQNAERRRKRASALARQLFAENTKLLTNCPIDDRAVRRMLALLQEHCKEAWLALNEIQRAWMCIDDTAAMIDEMYGWLYALYPPLFPAILRDLATVEELAATDEPALA